MRFFTTLTGAALVAAAAAKVAITDYPRSVQAGQTYTVKYEPATASVTLVLRQGNSGNLNNLGDVKATCSNGACSWTVSKSVVNGQQYALEIINSADPSDINYGANDIAVGGSTATASASASSASSASSSSASASESASTSAKSSGSTLSTTASVSLSTAASNSTVSLPTLSSSKASASSTAKSTGGSVTTTGGGAPQNTGAASTLGSSPLALIFGAVAAMAYLN